MVPRRCCQAAAAEALCCAQIVDASILKQYIFQKGFITEASKQRREAEAQKSTLQVRCAGCVGRPRLCWPATRRRLLEAGLCRAHVRTWGLKVGRPRR